MSDPYIIYQHAIEGLLRVIRPRMTQRLAERLRGAGLDVNNKPLPTYPFAAWREFLRICREELYASDGEEEGYRKFGEDFTGAYFQTVFGAPLAGIVRLLGPERTLKRATQSFRSANNFTECKVTEVEPRCWDMWMNHVDNNDFNVGIVRKALAIAGAKDVQVQIAAGPDYSASFRIRWR